MIVPSKLQIYEMTGETPNKHSYANIVWTGLASKQHT